MKPRVQVFLFSLVLLMTSCTSLPLLFEEPNVKPIKVWVDSPPEIVGNEAEEIILKYDWGGKKSDWEAKQNADGEITYKITAGKFAGGMHSYGSAVKYELEDKGELPFYFSSKVEGGNAMGAGRLMITLTCSYKDKSGNKHSGALGGVTLNVTFAKN